MTDIFHPVLTCAQAVELEQGLLKGDPETEWQAMKRAGRALGRAVLQDHREIGRLPDRPRLLVLAGKGHNAGDAFLAVAGILNERPRATVDVLFPMGEEALNTLARRAWSELLAIRKSEENIRSFSLDGQSEVGPQLAEMCEGTYQICLDGIFGMNFRPPFRGSLGAIVEWINTELKAELRAAVDLPSGLGDEPATVAVRADFSYMTGSAKAPLFEPANAVWAGRLRYLDLGFFSGAAHGGAERTVLLPEVLHPLRRLRDPLLHKRGYGHLVAVGGSRTMPGAILMSVLAAARSGVGLLTAAVPESLVAAFASIVPEAMWIGCPETEEGGLALGSLSCVAKVLPKATALLVGPGVGTERETQAFLEELVRKADLPLVLDAEALQREIVQRIAARPEMRGRAVATPHAGEFARISGKEFSREGEDALRAFCRETGFLTLLKGPPMTRFCDGASIDYGLAGGPVLARGGSGDLLAGITGGLVARTPDDVAGAVRRGLVWHGLAAEALARADGQEAVRTTQVLDFLPRVLRGESGAWREQMS